jgi:hypothetical protein
VDVANVLGVPAPLQSVSRYAVKGSPTAIGVPAPILKFTSALVMVYPATGVVKVDARYILLGSLKKVFESLVVAPKSCFNTETFPAATAPDNIGKDIRASCHSCPLAIENQNDQRKSETIIRV